MRILKILHFNPRWHPIIGGIITHISDIAASLADFEHEIVTHGSPGRLRFEQLSQNLWVRRIFPIDRKLFPFKNNLIRKILYPSVVVGDFLRMVLVNNYLRETMADLVHVHGPASGWMFEGVQAGLSVPYRLLSFLFGSKTGFSEYNKPRLLTLHGAPSEWNPSESDSERIAGFLQDFDQVICVDDHILDYIERALSITGLSRTPKLTLVPNWVDAQVFHFSELPDTSRLIVGIVGRVEKTAMDIDLILSLLRRSPPNTRFRIAGAGDPVFVKNVFGGVEENNYELEVNVPYGEMPRFFKSCHLILNPVTTSAITRVTLESMSSGRPVIMFGKGSRPPIIDRETGFLVERDVNQFLELLADISVDIHGSLSGISKSARTVIEEEYDLRVLMPRLRAIYEEISDRKD